VTDGQHAQVSVVDRDLSSAYTARLAEFLTSTVVDAQERFICTHASQCESSASAERYGFAGGQLSYVGAGYACVVAGRPMRVLVLSMQVGDAEAPVTMTRRSEQVLARIQPPRNPHMRGVTRALQLLHGLSTDPADEWLPGGMHVLDAYAMANSTLCSALPTGGKSRRGAPTTTMLRNCSTHLASTVESLEPTIIHTQGKQTIEALERVVSIVDRVSDEVSTAEFHGRRIIVCALSHPSSGPPYSWSSLAAGSYFADVAAPALLLAREVATN
jgi:hypothetical protein